MHEHEYEHVHYDDLGNEVIEEHKHSLFKTDRIELRSVGIDIGSSTSHLVFSSLELRRQGAALSSRFKVVGRRVDYTSPIIITPFLNGSSIDREALSAFLERAYEEAGVRPEQVDTGAVIATGDAARKDNAEAIVRLFSEQAGHFVCASAGPILEAKMAAYGSGAVLRSAHADPPITVLNIDVGGGTSKLAVVKAGRIAHLAAINVGARLVILDDHGVITHLEPAAAICARHLGLALRVGSVVTAATLAELTGALAETLLEAATDRPLSPLASDLMITEPLGFREPADVVLFSGGVSEYFYREASQSYHDLGELLADQIRVRASTFLIDSTIELPKERIRATVIGASQFTVQISGNTIYLANPDLLPLRNLRAIIVDLGQVEADAEAIERAIQDSLQRSEISEGVDPAALAIHWPHGPAYTNLQALCAGVAAALPNTVRNGRPVVLVLDSDVSRLVGENLSTLLQSYPDVICIDGVHLHDFDYIDISKEHDHTHTVTVAIKSLVFSG